MIYGVTGTLGRRVMRLTDQAMTAAGLGTGVAPPEPQGGIIGQIPILDRFIANKNKISQARSDFFDINEVLQEKWNTWQAMRDGNAQRTYKSDNKQDLRDARRWQGYSTAIHKLFNYERQIRFDRALSPQEKRRRIDELQTRINGLAMRALQERRERSGRR